MRRQVAGWVLASVAMSVSGCQSWSQVGQGIPSGARVPAPGTGTYQVPSSYYNNGAAPKSGAVSSNAQPSTGATAGTTTGSAAGTAAQTAALPTTGTAARTNAPATATTANWPIPTVDQVRTGINNTASAVFDDVGDRANQVVQAGTVRAASTVERYTDPAPSLRPVSTQPSASPVASSLAANASASSRAQPSSSSAAPAPSSAATSRSLRDDSTAEEPQLDWQPPQ